MSRLKMVEDASICFEDMQLMIEEGMAIIASLPSTYCFPAGFKTFWPELNDKWGYAGETRVMRRRYTPTEIDWALDFMLFVVRVLRDKRQRLTVTGYAAYCNTNVLGKHAVWPFLVSKIKRSERTLQRIYNKGIYTLVLNYNTWMSRAF